MVTSNRPQAVAATQLELEDIQGFVLGGYKHLPASVLAFLKMDNSIQAREWLKVVTPQVLSARRWSTDPNGQSNRPQTALNLALQSRDWNCCRCHWPGF